MMQAVLVKKYLENAEMRFTHTKSKKQTNKAKQTKQTSRHKTDVARMPEDSAGSEAEYENLVSTLEILEQLVE
jgi:hypothetical protein